MLKRILKGIKKWLSELRTNRVGVGLPIEYCKERGLKREMDKLRERIWRLENKVERLQK